MALTFKQKLFCEEYVAAGYQRQAECYMKAFPDASLATAKTESNKLLKREPILAYLRELQADRFKKLNVSAERIAEELSKMAFAELDENNTTASKARALELLQKQLGLQTQKVEADIKTTTIEIGLEDGRED